MRGAARLGIWWLWIVLSAFTVAWAFQSPGSSPVRSPPPRSWWEAAGAIAMMAIQTGALHLLLGARLQRTSAPRVLGALVYALLGAAFALLMNMGDYGPHAPETPGTEIGSAMLILLLVIAVALLAAVEWLRRTMAGERRRDGVARRARRPS